MLKKLFLHDLMKKLSFYILISALIFGCEPKFDPSDDWQAIDVVYSVLDPDAEKQYVQIGRGFQNKDENAEDLAKIQDSIYHQDSAIVELIELANNGEEVARVSLQRQLFDDREEGVFINPEHYLYILNATDYKVKDKTSYKIRVTNSATLKTSYAEIKTLQEYGFGNAFPEVNINIIDKDGEVKDQPITIKNGNGEDVIYSLNLILPYVTKDEDDNIVSRDSMEIIVNKNKKGDVGSETAFSLSGDKLIDAFLEQVEVLPAGSKSTRELDIPYLKGMCYGPEMYEYVLAEESFNALSQTKPFYTNIYDEDTDETQSGLFTSLKIEKQVVVISNKSIKYISALEPRLGFPQ